MATGYSASQTCSCSNMPPGASVQTRLCKCQIDLSNTASRLPIKIFRVFLHGYEPLQLSCWKAVHLPGSKAGWSSAVIGCCWDLQACAQAPGCQSYPAEQIAAPGGPRQHLLRPRSQMDRMLQAPQAAPCSDACKHSRLVQQTWRRPAEKSSGHTSTTRVRASSFRNSLGSLIAINHLTRTELDQPSFRAGQRCKGL